MACAILLVPIGFGKIDIYFGLQYKVYVSVIDSMDESKANCPNFEQFQSLDCIIAWR